MNVNVIREIKVYRYATDKRHPWRYSIYADGFGTVPIAYGSAATCDDALSAVATAFKVETAPADPTNAGE